MNIRYVKKAQDKAQGEVCIDLVQGFLAPSWQARNLLMYEPGTEHRSKQQSEDYYKRELLLFWKEKQMYDSEEETKNAQKSLEVLRESLANDSPLCIVTTSGGPTAYSKIFLLFLDYAKNSLAS